jgi:transcription elongation factor Elf1
MDVETKREVMPVRCYKCGSQAVLRVSDAEGTLPWLYCDVCRKYGGRPKNFWCPECRSQDFLDYTELGKNDKGLLYCSACQKTGTQWEFAQRPRPWHWRYWKTRIDMRSLIFAASMIVGLHISATHNTFWDVFGRPGPAIMMGFLFYWALSQTFDDRR